MRKISGQLLSSKPVSLDRAAKILTSFASVDNGSSATLSLYLQRTADAFTDLLQFHGKRSKFADAENGPRRKKPRRSESESPGKNSDEDLKIRVNEANPNEDEVKAEKKKKKKKKKKTKSGGDEGLDS